MSALTRLNPLLVLMKPKSIPNLKLNSVRHGGDWAYRSCAPTVSKTNLFKAGTVGFLTWYWILYHIWYEPEHIIGHFPYPVPSKWTDEELGIPPDDE